MNYLPTSAQDRLEALIQRNLGTVFPACALAVIKNGETVLDAGWGTVEGTPATNDTLYDLASVTKLFTVTAFLAYVSAGHVALDEPVVKLIPEFGALNPRSMDGGQIHIVKFAFLHLSIFSAKRLTLRSSPIATC